MKAYALFRAAEGGVLIQHPDCPDALAEGPDLISAMKIMASIEQSRGLEPIQNQLKTAALMARIE